MVSSQDVGTVDHVKKIGMCFSVTGIFVYKIHSSVYDRKIMIYTYSRLVTMFLVMLQ